MLPGHHSDVSHTSTTMHFRWCATILALAMVHNRFATPCLGVGQQRTCRLQVSSHGVHRWTGATCARTKNIGGFACHMRHDSTLPFECQVVAFGTYQSWARRTHRCCSVVSDVYETSSSRREKSRSSNASAQASILSSSQKVCHLSDVMICLPSFSATSPCTGSGRHSGLHGKS